MTTVLLPAGSISGVPAGTLDWPSTPELQPSGMRLGLRPARSAWQAVYTRQRTAVSHLADRLAATLSFPPCVGAAIGVREAFLAHLAASNPWLRLRHFAQPVIGGSLRGTPVLAADAAAGARTISLTQATAGANLIYGGGMERDANSDGVSDYWTPYSSGTTGVISHSRVAGNSSIYCQRIDASGLGTASTDQVGYRHTVDVPVVAGATYALAADTRDYDIPVRLYIDWYTSGLVLISNASQTFAGSGASWQRCEMTAAAPATAAYARLYVWTQERPSAAGPAALEMDNVQFERAAAATDYAGAPTLAGGDVLGIGGTLAQVSYLGATGLDVGDVTVNLSWPLRVAAEAGDVVTWSRPTGTFQLESVADLQYTAGIVQDGFELTFLEVV